MLTRCGMLPRALWSQSRASCFLGRSSRRHSNQSRFTRLRNNHVALEGYGLTGESNRQIPAIRAVLSPIEPATWFCKGVFEASRLLLLGERLPHRPCVPRGTRQRLDLKAERRAYRLSVEDRWGPAGFAASGSRPTRVSPEAPACELSQQSGSLVEVKALARRRHHRSLSGIRGGARETHVAQPEDAGAPCGQAQRGVHSIHRARARSQDLSGSLISRKPGSRLPVDISGSARPGGSAAIGCRVEVNALTRRCLSRSSA